MSLNLVCSALHCQMSIEDPLYIKDVSDLALADATANTINADMFSTVTGTPLYSPTWMPMSSSADARTCLLIVLAIILVLVSR